MEKELKSIDRVKEERKQVRRLVSLSFKKLQSLLEAEQPDQSALTEEFIKVQDKIGRLFDLDRLIGDILFNSKVEESELSIEFDKVEEYREKWLVFKAKIEKIKASSLKERDDLVSSVKRCKKFQMFKLKPKVFDGSLKEWIGFWASFRHIHEDEELEDDEKFQYLLQATKEGSPARELLDSFPPSKENYQKAVGQLKNRFGREGLLVQLYVRELLKIILFQASGESKLAIRELYIKLETQLRALETMGFTQDKYADMLMPLVESCLPETVLKDWERERMTKKDNDTVDAACLMERLLSFMRREVESEERMELARNTFFKEKEGKKLAKIREVKERFQVEKVPTAAGLINSKPFKLGCVFCTGQHHNDSCFKAQDLDAGEVLDILKKNGCCFLCCRKGHNQRHCKVNLRCVVCRGRHSPIVCPERRHKADRTETKAPIENNLASTCLSPVLLQTLKAKVIGENSTQVARVLIDTASQRSYILKQLAEKLNYQPLGEEKLAHALFGGDISDPKRHLQYKVHLSSMNGNYLCNFDVLDSKKICQAVPRAADGPWVRDLEEKGIELTDTTEGPIDILIGADVAGKLLTGRKEVLSGGLVALETLLGWTLLGRIKSAENCSMCDITLFSSDISESDLWRLDVVGIEDPAQVKTREEKANAAKCFFEETVQTLADGRYEVRLPWVEDHPPLPRNFSLSEKRLQSTVKRLRAMDKLEAYEAVLLDWLQKEIIEELSATDWDKGHYLPHRPVFKENSTTKIRPVFDASANEKGQPSLNLCIEKGVNLIELIPSILLRFRFGSVGVIADIEKAFLQISLHQQDRDYLRFLWIAQDSDNIRIFRHRRVVFGLASSPFLLGAVLQHHLSKCKELTQKGNRTYSLSVMDQLMRSLYVDNCVTSLSDNSELNNFIKQATSIFAEARFILRGWEYTDPTLTASTETPLLGIIWDRKLDSLRINVNKWNRLDTEVVSRRTILSSVQRIFDPVGLLAPTMLVPKLLMQRSWIKEDGWDTPVDVGTKTELLTWIKDVPLLSDLRIPRWLEGWRQESAESSLHTFCDASQVAYAAEVFLRIKWNDTIKVYLIEAKSRVAPIRKVTIPRLELLAATIGARLTHNILKQLGQIRAYYWSDSTTVLAWIRRNEPWGVFVWNRVQEIRQLSSANCWNHVPGTINPADLLSRGCSPRQLIKSRWWEGPSWLTRSEEAWPKEEFCFDEGEVLKERRKTTTVAVANVDYSFSSKVWGSRLSSYNKILRVAGWMIRFLCNKFLNKKNYLNYLSVQEISRAERWILKLVQDESFAGVQDQKLKRLKPHVDSTGLIRLRTKIWARKDSEDFRSPIILPSDHEIVSKLVEEIHKANGHVVGQGLLNLLRERFWIIKGRQTVRRILKKCSTCQRFMTNAFKVESPPLPENRVRDARVFEVSGVDFAGPLYLNSGDKVWICLFTCAIYRAIHMEVVTSLSTEDFMLAFRRFISRRGRPSVIYSDNGTNFVGLNNALGEIDWTKVASRGSAEKIEWRFNPPAAPWWGGFWERLIGLVKSTLRKTIGRSSLNMEELRTLVCECEGFVNSRPITYVSDDCNNPTPILPKMFTQEIEEDGVPDFDIIEAHSLRRRLRHRHLLKEELRRRFRIEYLGLLKLPPKGKMKGREPVVGEVVLVEVENTKKLSWPLATVKELIRGTDGHVRVVRLKTAGGELLRAVQRVYPLEMHACGELKNPEPEEENLTKNEEQRVCVKTRSGRLVKVPLRFYD